MKRADRLARLLLIRLKEIDPSKGGPHDQSPDVYAEVAGKGTWDWKLKPVSRT